MNKKQARKRKKDRARVHWDISGFVRLFYISSKNEIFSHFPKNIPYFGQ